MQGHIDRFGGFKLKAVAITLITSVRGRSYHHCMSRELLDRITFSTMQCGGRPCIRGMRIRVGDVLEMLAGDVAEAQILVDFPDLQLDDIRACLHYAATR